MALSALTALSPLDGRYAAKVENLRPISSPLLFFKIVYNKLGNFWIVAKVH